MELEIVSTINGRKATRAKAWRVCETGVTYYEQRWLGTRNVPPPKQKMSDKERFVLDLLRDGKDRTMTQIRFAFDNVRPTVSEIRDILNRLIASGHIEHVIGRYGEDRRVRETYRLATNSIRA